MKLFTAGFEKESVSIDQFKSLLGATQIDFKEGDSTEKDGCDFLLYVVTPETKSIDLIVNVTNDSNVQKGETIFCSVNNVNGKQFTEHQIKSLKATGIMIDSNGGQSFESLEESANYILSRTN